MKVGIVGGGIVGLCTAWSLRRRGHSVTVIEGGHIGESASAVNAGWVTPSLSTPLASPGVLATGLKHAFQKDGALVIRPQLDTSWLRWLWKFHRASRPQAYSNGVKALMRLNNRTLELFDLLHSDGVKFEMHEAGILALAREANGLEWFEQLFDELQPLGFPGRIDYLTGDEARAIEPGVGAGVVKAALTSIDRHVNPDSLLVGLADWLRRSGVDILEETPVTALTAHGDGWLIDADDAGVEVDRVVVALGAATNRLIGPLGVQLPILGAKGYSVLVRGLAAPPTRALYLMEAKLGLSPFEDGVRIAGVFELPGRDARVEQHRTDGLVRHAGPYLEGLDAAADIEVRESRAGLRPATPDSLPFISELPTAPGVFVAAGHGMLGVTLAPATADVIAELIEGRSPQGVESFAISGRLL